MAYFSDVYNVTDLAGYALKIIMVVVWIDLAGSCADFQSERHYQVFADTMATGRVLRLNDEIGQLQEVMMQLENIAGKVMNYEQLCTFAIVVMVVQLIQKLNFHPRMGVISRTISNALEDLIFFFVLFGLIVFCYAYLGCLLYGKLVSEFSGILLAVPTMLLTLCGMYDYTSIPDSLTLTTQLFFWSYMVISFFIMLNALLAIIVDAYTQVAELHKSKDPLPFTVRALFGWLNKDVIHVERSAMLSVLEKWAGSGLNQQDFSEDDDMDDVINRDRLHSQPLHDDLPRVDYSAFHRSLKDGRENDSDLFYRWKGDDNDDDIPLALLDQRLLALAIEVAEAHYAGASGAARLSETGRQVMACNILERYGTRADADGDGVIEAHEKEAVMQLLRISPHLTHSTSSAQAKLALVYNFFRKVVDLPATLDAPPPHAQGSAGADS